MSFLLRLSQTLTGHIETQDRIMQNVAIRRSQTPTFVVDFHACRAARHEQACKHLQGSFSLHFCSKCTFPTVESVPLLVQFLTCCGWKWSERIESWQLTMWLCLTIEMLLIRHLWSTEKGKYSDKALCLWEKGFVLAMTLFTHDDTAMGWTPHRTVLYTDHTRRHVLQLCHTGSLPGGDIELELTLTRHTLPSVGQALQYIQFPRSKTKNWILYIYVFYWKEQHKWLTNWNGMNGECFQAGDCGSSSSLFNITPFPPPPPLLNKTDNLMGDKGGRKPGGVEMRGLLKVTLHQGGWLSGFQKQGLGNRGGNGVGSKRGKTPIPMGKILG